LSSENGDEELKKMKKIYPESKVEIHDFAAKYYDNILNIATFGTYPFFIRKVIASMNIMPRDRILDLGAGSGRNALLMRQFLSKEGEIVGLDISDDMIAQFEQNTRRFENMKIFNRRIDEPLDYENKFDKVFISFVLHGLPHPIRKTVIQNAFKALKPGGTFFILDYNEFNLNEMPPLIRIPFKIIECPYAFDFIEKDWKQILEENKFSGFQEHLFFHNYVRLLGAKK